MSEHRGEDAALDVLDVRKFPHILIRALHRAVYGVVGEVEEKRLRAMPFDEVAGFAREGIGDIRFLID